MYTEIPLKERLLVASIKPPSHSFNATIPRKATYKSWSEGNLYKAYLSHVEEGLSVRRAAEAHGVPKSTLQDRVSGRVPFGKKSGPSKFLSDEEEFELVNFICGCAAVGYAKSKQQIIALVRNIVSSKGMEGAIVTDGWWTSFKKRHGQLTVRAAEPLSYFRAVSTSPQIISRYFDLLEQTLIDNDLMNAPTQIFNMDETGMPLDPHPSKVVTVRGVKHAMSVTTGCKAQITVVSVCSAAGYVLPPMVIFDRKTLKPELTYGEVPGTIYGLSKNGWIDTELFELWFKQHFLPNAPPIRPLLLIMDGHSTHYQPNVIRLAAAEQILLFCLPPNTTHLTQPMDKGCFGALKQSWKKQCHDFVTGNPGKVVTRYEFSRLLSKAWFESMTQQNVISSFRCTGICPFNRDAIQLPISNGRKSFDALEKETGLKFIPLYTCTNSPSVRQVRDSLEEGNSTPFVPCLQRQTAVTRMLMSLDNIPQLKVPEERLKNCGRVLTSADNMKALELKEKEKEEKKQNQELRKQKQAQRKAAKENCGILVPNKHPEQNNGK